MVQTLTAARTEPGRSDLAVLDYIKFNTAESKGWPVRAGGVGAGPECKGEMRSGPGDLKREVRGNLTGFSDMTRVRP